jgi:serine phosphatase RsbU (regulator of sigma subunit)
MEAYHRDNADDTTKLQQHQAQSSQAGRPPPIVLTSQGNLMQLQRLTERQL